MAPGTGQNIWRLRQSRAPENTSRQWSTMPKIRLPSHLSHGRMSNPLATEARK